MACTLMTSDYSRASAFTWGHKTHSCERWVDNESTSDRFGMDRAHKLISRRCLATPYARQRYHDSAESMVWGQGKLQPCRLDLDQGLDQEFDQQQDLSAFPAALALPTPSPSATTRAPVPGPIPATDPEDVPVASPSVLDWPSMPYDAKHRHVNSRRNHLAALQVWIRTIKDTLQSFNPHLIHTSFFKDFKVLGTGAFGCVSASMAHHTNSAFDTKVAIKRTKPFPAMESYGNINLVSLEQAIAELSTEAEMLKEAVVLAHLGQELGTEAGVVTLLGLEVGDQGEVLGLVMPLVEGLNMTEYKEARGWASIADADLVEVPAQVAETLAKLHENGWVLGDVKPLNIQLHVSHGSAERASLGPVGPADIVSTEVLDVAMAVRLDLAQGVTASRDLQLVRSATGKYVYGTPGFCDPWVEEYGHITLASDVYSFGMTMRVLGLDSLLELAPLVHSCTNPTSPLDRPSMAQVVVQLREYLAHCE